MASPESRVITATAPVRICDIGGWTDTWFGGPGRVVNLAVTPGVTVTIETHRGAGPIVLDVDGARRPVPPGPPRTARYPLVRAALDARPPPSGVAMEVSVRSALPPGSGAGTSAAVAVALLGALAAVGDEPLDARAAAYAAHRLEVDVLGGESGIQDQLCAALGGVNFMEIDVYPEATVHPLPEWNDLDDRLTLVYLGRPHDSSAIHRQVIAAATTSGFGAGAGPGPLDRLRGAALAARDAIIGRDVAALGRAMIDNTDAQDALHPSLVSPAARRIIDTARSLGAIGWKVNGAGGEGGSLTLLSPDRPSRQQLQESLGAGVIPIRLSAAGLVVT